MEAAVRDRLAVRSMELVELDLPNQTGDGFAFTVDLRGVERRLVLRPYSLRSPDFQLMQRDADGKLVSDGPIPPPCTVRGTIEGMPGSEIAGSLADGQLDALIRLDANPNVLFCIQSAKSIVPDASARTHVIYESTAVLPTEARCGVVASGLGTAPPGPLDTRQRLESPGGATQGTARVIEVLFETDYEFWQSNGSSISAVVRDIELVMTSVDVIYRRDVDISIWLWSVVYDDSPGGYIGTNADLLLAQFRNNHSFPPNPPWDGWHLMSGRTLDDSVVGIAYQPGFCTTGNPNFAFGLSAAKHINSLVARAAVTAHELGHNWSAGHCDGNPGCDLMCSELGGCSGNMTSFTLSAPIIAFYRDSPPCAGVTALPAHNVWIDWRNTSPDQDGTPSNPFSNIGVGYRRVEPGGTVSIANGVYAESHYMGKAATLVATGGSVEITGYSSRSLAPGGETASSTNARNSGRR
jgi:hypothetical protein